MLPIAFHADILAAAKTGSRKYRPAAPWLDSHAWHTMPGSEERTLAIRRAGVLRPQSGESIATPSIRSRRVLLRFEFRIFREASIACNRQPSDGRMFLRATRAHLPKVQRERRSPYFPCGDTSRSRGRQSHSAAAPDFRRERAASSPHSSASCRRERKQEKAVRQDA